MNVSCKSERSLKTWDKQVRHRNHGPLALVPQTFSYSLGTGGNNTAFTIDTSGQLKTTVALNASTKSSFSIVVTSTDQGGLSVTKNFTVTVTPPLVPPAITSLSVHSGTTLGGTSIVIGGVGFTSVSAVLFGGALASSFVVNSPTRITVVAPAHNTGTVGITIVTSLGASPTSTSSQFTFQTPIGLPTISTVSPGTATTSGGDAITITGTNFTGATSVSFGGTAATSFTVNSATSITAIAPVHVSGQVDVQVTTAVGVSATTASDQLTFTIPVLPPTVIGISTSTGSTAGGNGTSTTPERRIPNRVPGRGEKLPFGNSLADGISVESSPIFADTATEIARVLKPGGSVRLFHREGYAKVAHQRVIDAVGGTYQQWTIDGLTTTVITAPR